MHTINETLRFVNISSALTLRPNPHELRVTFFNYYRFEPATTRCCKPQHRAWNKPTMERIQHATTSNMQQRAQATCMSSVLLHGSPHAAMGYPPHCTARPPLVPRSAPRCALRIPGAPGLHETRIGRTGNRCRATKAALACRGLSVRRLCWFVRQRAFPQVRRARLLDARRDVCLSPSALCSGERIRARRQDSERRDTGGRCELYLPFNMPIIVWLSVPLEFGRENYNRWFRPPSHTPRVGYREYLSRACAPCLPPALTRATLPRAASS